MARLNYRSGGVSRPQISGPIWMEGGFLCTTQGGMEIVSKLQVEGFLKTIYATPSKIIIPEHVHKLSNVPLAKWAKNKTYMEEI